MKPRSDLDAGVPDGIDDQAYLDLLGQHLPWVPEAGLRSGAAAAMVLAGGYAMDTSDTVESHLNRCWEAVRVIGGTAG